MNRRGAIATTIGGLLAATGAGGWSLYRKHRERAILAEARAPDFRPQFTAVHVSALRKVRFAWDPLVESGGPMVDPDTPYGSRDIASDLAGLTGSRDWLAMLSLHVEVMALLLWAMKHAPMTVGPYPIDRSVRERMAAGLRHQLAHYPAESVARTIGQFSFLNSGEAFIFSLEHLLLLRRLRFSWPDSRGVPSATQRWGRLPVVTVNFKRPFGDMTAFDLDMAHILGLPRPDPRPSPATQRLNSLYDELWAALQVFVANADIRVSEAQAHHLQTCAQR